MFDKTPNDKIKKSLSEFSERLFLDEKSGCLFKTFFNSNGRFWQDQV
jgi:hypothetical protein